MSNLVFVYGTLKRGLCNSHYMAGQEFVAEARTEPRFRLVDCGGYPGMYPVPDDGLSIKGEVWLIDEACRAHLDVLEDIAVGLYRVEKVALLPPFEDTEVFTYIYNWPTSGRFDVGDEWTE